MAEIKRRTPGQTKTTTPDTPPKQRTPKKKLAEYKEVSGPDGPILFRRAENSNPKGPRSKSPESPRESRYGTKDTRSPRSSRDSGSRPSRSSSDSRPPRDPDSRPSRSSSDSRPPRDSGSRPSRSFSDSRPPRDPDSRPSRSFSDSRPPRDFSKTPRSYNSESQDRGSSRSFSSRPQNSFGGRAVPKPAKGLKDRQITAIKAAVNREIPEALKRLDEAGDTLLTAAGNILDLAERIQEHNSATESQDTEANKKELPDIASKLFEMASFQDLAGQRLEKVSEFLKSISLALEDILAGESEKSREYKTDRKRPKGSSRATGAPALKKTRAKPETSELKGPSLDGLNQGEVEDLIKKLKV